MVPTKEIQTRMSTGQKLSAEAQFFLFRISGGTSCELQEQLRAKIPKAQSLLLRRAKVRRASFRKLN